MGADGGVGSGEGQGGGCIGEEHFHGWGATDAAVLEGFRPSC